MFEDNLFTPVGWLRACEALALNVALLRRSGESRNPDEFTNMLALPINRTPPVGSGLRRNGDGKLNYSQTLMESVSNLIVLIGLE